jgi:hypothetical protein
MAKANSKAASVTKLPRVVEAPRNLIIDDSDDLRDKLDRAHAFAAFLQTEAEQRHQGELRGEGYGRAIAHEMLTDALDYLMEKAAVAKGGAA